MRENREKPANEAMRRHSKPPATSRKGNTGQLKRRSHRRQTERGSKAWWDAKQVDRHSASRWSPRIARQPFFPGEAIPGTLCPGKRALPVWWLGRQRLWKGNLNPLVAQQMPTGMPMNSAAPVTPEDRRRTDHHWM